MSNPFAVLGIEPTADHEVIRGAWRSLAKTHHPDVGGSQEKMKILNVALEEALLYTGTEEKTTFLNRSSRGRSNVSTPIRHEQSRSQRVQHDVSSFTIDLLPVESFEVLQIVASTVGEVIDDECPYMIEFTMNTLNSERSGLQWCRCDLVPEAGGTMVHLSIEGTITSIETVRDEIIRCINDLDS